MSEIKARELFHFTCSCGGEAAVIEVPDPPIDCTPIAVTHTEPVCDAFLHKSASDYLRGERAAQCARCERNN